MPKDYKDPIVINFLKETMTKSDEKRTYWFLKNRDMLEKRYAFGKDFKDIRTEDVSRKLIEGVMPALTKENELSAVNRRKIIPWDITVKPAFKDKSAKQDTSLLHTEKDSFPKHIMKAVDEKEASILYKSVPKHGRRRYLDLRNQKNPEDKYYDPVYSSHVYGWRLGDCELKFIPSKHGRNAISFNSRTGFQPNPHYYKEPDKVTKSTCIL